MAGFNHFNVIGPLYERFIDAQPPEALRALIDGHNSGWLLDAGGGTGRVSQFLLDKADHVLVADQSIGMLRQTHAKSGLLASLSDTECLPFENELFSTIIMVDALHHVNHQAHTVHELWRVLKPGGKIIIEEPDIRSFYVKLIALGEKLALMRSHFLSPQAITKLFPTSKIRISNRAKEHTAWIIAEKESVIP